MPDVNCPQCDECSVEFCWAEVDCNVYSCGCCCDIPIKLIPNTTLVRGTIVAQRATDGLWGAFDPTATDGLQIPRGVLRYDTVVDANGRIKRATGMFGTSCGDLYTNAWICGTFRIETTPNHLAEALSHESFGRLVEGNIGGTGVWKLV
jgi:hypothetical protein